MIVECRADSHEPCIVYQFRRLTDGVWIPIITRRPGERWSTIVVDGAPPGTGPDRIRMHCRRCGLNVTVRTDSRSWARLSHLLDRLTAEHIGTVTLRGLAGILT